MNFLADKNSAADSDMGGGLWSESLDDIHRLYTLSVTGCYV